MTSPMFAFPQPTDAELASQQPEYRQEVSTASGSAGLGRIALIIAVVAVGLSLIASGVLGSTIGPMEAAHGAYFFDTPTWYSNLGIVLICLQVVCTVLGLTSLVMAIIAIVTGRGRTQGIVASAIAVLGPIVSIGIFLILGLAVSTLG